MQANSYLALSTEKNMADIICNYKKLGVKKRNCFFKYAIEDNQVA